MKRIVLLMLALCTMGGKALSQELNLPQMNQYLADSEFLIAPTYAGIGDFVRIRLSAGTQWVGVKGACGRYAFRRTQRRGAYAL